MWKNRDKEAKCNSCIYYLEKVPAKAAEASSYVEIGRCRRHCPVACAGYPVVFPVDWCGDYKLDENKIQ